MWQCCGLIPLEKNILCLLKRRGGHPVVYSVFNTIITTRQSIFLHKKQTEAETLKQTKKIERSIKTIKEVL